MLQRSHVVLLGKKVLFLIKPSPLFHFLCSSLNNLIVDVDASDVGVGAVLPQQSGLHCLIIFP